MRFGIITFPGSNCDHDCFHVVKDVLNEDALLIWHRDTDLKGADCVILPGGFSYGDYLRSGAMAACSPVISSIREFAKNGGIVLGICNGFQILQEAKLLPGALMRNSSLKFICRDVFMRVERTDTPFTCACKEGGVIRMPVAHMDGNFFMEESGVSKLKRSGHVLFSYSDENGRVSETSNPNGSVLSIAGVLNENGNVMGLMPHPERASESILGNSEGRKIFESIILDHERKLCQK